MDEINKILRKYNSDKWGNKIPGERNTRGHAFRRTLRYLVNNGEIGFDAILPAEKVAINLEDSKVTEIRKTIRDAFLTIELQEGINSFINVPIYEQNDTNDETYHKSLLAMLEKLFSLSEEILDNLIEDLSNGTFRPYVSEYNCGYKRFSFSVNAFMDYLENPEILLRNFKIKCLRETPDLIIQKVVDELELGSQYLHEMETRIIWAAIDYSSIKRAISKVIDEIDDIDYDYSSIEYVDIGTVEEISDNLNIFDKIRNIINDKSKEDKLEEIRILGNGITLDKFKYISDFYGNLSELNNELSISGDDKSVLTKYIEEITHVSDTIKFSQIFRVLYAKSIVDNVFFPEADVSKFLKIFLAMILMQNTMPNDAEASPKQCFYFKWMGNQIKEMIKAASADSNLSGPVNLMSFILGFTPKHHWNTLKNLKIGII